MHGFRTTGAGPGTSTSTNFYVDEFQSFMNLSIGFERILAEARKYRLVLTMANQYVGQLSHDVRQAVFGNAGTLITFRPGVQDAATVAREMGVFTAEEILSLGVGEAIARGGGSETAFNLTTFPASSCDRREFELFKDLVIHKLTDDPNVMACT